MMMVDPGSEDGMRSRLPVFCPPASLSATELVFSEELCCPADGVVDRGGLPAQFPLGLAVVHRRQDVRKPGAGARDRCIAAHYSACDVADAAEEMKGTQRNRQPRPLHTAFTTCRGNRARFSTLPPHRSRRRFSLGLRNALNR